MILFGISNCDTVKKAKKWLENNAVDFSFHDLRKDGLTEKHLSNWLKDNGLDVLINKRSTTWKNLSDEQKSLINSVIEDSNTSRLNKSVTSILLNNPTLIKRPILTNKHVCLVGFKESEYIQHIN